MKRTWPAVAVLVLCMALSAPGQVASAHVAPHIRTSLYKVYGGIVGDGSGREYAGVELTIAIRDRGRPDVRCVVRYWDSYYGYRYFRHIFRDVRYRQARTYGWYFMAGSGQTASVRHCHFL